MLASKTPHNTLHAQQDAAALWGLAWNVEPNSSTQPRCCGNRTTREGPVDFCGGGAPICGPHAVPKTNIWLFPTDSAQWNALHLMIVLYLLSNTYYTAYW